MQLRLILSVIAATLAVSGVALAAEGVIEINQARALAGGVTSGDSAGYPITIDQAGSYALTSSLDPSPADAIYIQADDVSIDLRGFRVKGSISDVNSGAARTTLLNGAVSDGDIVLGDDAMAANLKLSGGSISMQSGSLAVDNTLVSVGPTPAISVGDQSAVRGNRIRNAGSCIVAGEAAQIENNSVELCFADGLEAGKGSKIVGNTIKNVSGAGIRAFSGSLVTQNVVRSAGGYGYQLGSSVALEGNVFVENNGGNANSQGLGGIEIGKNVCGTDSNCP